MYKLVGVILLIIGPRKSSQIGKSFVKLGMISTLILMGILAINPTIACLNIDVGLLLQLHSFYGLL